MGLRVAIGVLSLVAVAGVGGARIIQAQKPLGRNAMTLEAMVQELWDREKIRELTYEYGLAIEAQDAERMASLFTADGSVDFTSLGRGVIKGREALKEFYRSTWPLRRAPRRAPQSFAGDCRG